MWGFLDEATGSHQQLHVGTTVTVMFNIRFSVSFSLIMLKDYYSQ